MRLTPSKSGSPRFRSHSNSCGTAGKVVFADKFDSRRTTSANLDRRYGAGLNLSGCLIFYLFVSSKGARGTGLGLPVSQKILREHGGRHSRNQPNWSREESVPPRVPAQRDEGQLTREIMVHVVLRSHVRTRFPKFVVRFTPFEVHRSTDWNLHVDCLHQADATLVISDHCLKPCRKWA